MKFTQLARVFFAATAGFLLLTAAAKLYSAAGTAEILSRADPIVLLKNQHLLAGLGMVEALIGAYLLFGRSLFARSAVLFWLSANFLMYRYWMYLLGIKACSCLGTIAGQLPLTSAQIEYLLGGFVLFALAGSGAFLWHYWAERTQGSIVESRTLSSTASGVEG